MIRLRDVRAGSREALLIELAEVEARLAEAEGRLEAVADVERRLARAHETRSNALQRLNRIAIWARRKGYESLPCLGVPE